MPHGLFDLSPRTAIAPHPIEHDQPCVRCGYNLRGLKSLGRCPECGTLIRGPRAVTGLLMQVPAPHLQRLARWSVIAAASGTVILALPPVFMILRFLLDPPAGVEKALLAACLLGVVIGAGAWSLALRHLVVPEPHDGTIPHGPVNRRRDFLRIGAHLAACSSIGLTLILAPYLAGLVLLPPTTAPAPAGLVMRAIAHSTVFALACSYVTVILGCMHIARLVEWTDEITLARRLRGSVIYVPVFSLNAFGAALLISQICQVPTRLFWLSAPAVFFVCAALWSLYLIAWRLAEVVGICHWAVRNQVETFARERRVNEAILRRIGQGQARAGTEPASDPPPVPLAKPPPRRPPADAGASPLES